MAMGRLLRGTSTWTVSLQSLPDSSRADPLFLAVTIGGVAVPKQAVELAEKMSAQFSSGEGSDGLLGLAWPAINTVSPTPVKTPVQNMIEQKLITQPLFTVKLDRGDNAGFYSFGEVYSSSFLQIFIFVKFAIDRHNRYVEPNHLHSGRQVRTAVFKLALCG
jgi:hypothetical protein